MKIRIFGETWNTDTNTLLERINFSVEDLWLSDFVEVDVTTDESLKTLWFTKTPALIIEEESIDFKDVIFEWIVPDTEELKSMFVSIIWGWDGGSCSTWGWCSSWSCGTWGWCSSCS